jgi:hypothetical protein
MMTDKEKDEKRYTLRISSEESAAILDDLRQYTRCSTMAAAIMTAINAHKHLSEEIKAKERKIAKLERDLAFYKDAGKMLKKAITILTDPEPAQPLPDEGWDKQ